MSEGSSAARHSLSVFITKIAVYGLAFGSSVIVARMLGVDLRGYYAALLLFGSLWMPIASFGMGGCATYLVGRGEFRPKDVALTVILQGFLQGLLVMLLAVAFKYFQLLGSAVDSIGWPLYLTVIAVLPCHGIFQMGSRLIIGDHWYKMSNVLSILNILIPVIFQITIIAFHPHWLFKSTEQYEGDRLKFVVLSYAMSQLILAATIIGIVLFKYRPTRFWNKSYMQRCWNYGFKVWWGDITTVANLRGDQQVLTKFSTPQTMAQMGYFGIAATLSEILWLLPDSLNTVLFNKIAASRSQSERANLTEHVHRITFWTMAVLIVVIAILVPPFLWLVFGEQYAPAKWPFWFLLPGTLFLTTTKVITKYFAASGKPGIASLTTLVGMVAGLTSCVLVLIFLPSWGTTGVAAASSFGYLCTAVYSIILYRREVSPEKPRLFKILPSDWKWLTSQLSSLKS